MDPKTLHKKTFSADTTVRNFILLQGFVADDRFYDGLVMETRYCAQHVLLLHSSGTIMRTTQVFSPPKRQEKLKEPNLMGYFFMPESERPLTYIEGNVSWNG